MWTATALASEAHPRSGVVWRTVENQARSSTRALVDTSQEHEILEDLLEASKPPIPQGANDLHYLMATPFRYLSPYPVGSRFREAGASQGVFYGSESVATALAEIVYFRLRFFRESPQTPLPRRHEKITAFSAKYQTSHAIDLSAPPFDAQCAIWMHPTNYAPTQVLATVAREAKIDVIRYQSVRDPEHGHNLALLSPVAFAASKPHAYQQWQLYLTQTEANCERLDKPENPQRLGFCVDATSSVLARLEAEVL